MKKKLIKEKQSELDEQLFNAITTYREKDVKNIIHLIIKGANLYIKDECGMTPLASTAYSDKNIEIIKLIDKNIINFPNDNGIILLYYAVA